MAFAGHVLRGSSGKDLLDVLEGKLNSKLFQGRLVSIGGRRGQWLKGGHHGECGVEVCGNRFFVPIPSHFNDFIPIPFPFPSET